MKCLRTMLALLILIALPLAAAADPAAAPDDAVIIYTGQAASPEDARLRFRPIEPATLAVEVGALDGRQTAVLVTNFSRNSSWRVAWDFTGQWDLSRCPRFEVEVFVAGDAPATLMIYFHSGGGWYGRQFGAAPGRQTVTIERRKFRVEEKPGPWQSVDTMRICVLRDGAGDRQVVLGPVRGVVLPPVVGIYRNDAGLARESGIPQYVEAAAALLDRLEIGYEILSDTDVAAGRLAGLKVALLPLNPVLPPAAAARLQQFVAPAAPGSGAAPGNGGKLLVCYSLPQPLGALLGVRETGVLLGQESLDSFAFQLAGQEQPLVVPQQSWLARQIVTEAGTTVRGHWRDAAGKASQEPAVTASRHGFYIGHVLTPAGPQAKEELLLEMLGELWPGLWQSLWERRQQRLGRVLGQADLGELEAAILANLAGRQDPRPGRLLRQVYQGNDRAQAAAELGDYRAAARHLAQAQDDCLSALAASIPAQVGEFRAAWCHDPRGIPGQSWQETMDQLAAAGFNAVIVNMLWGGAAAYPGGPLAQDAKLAGSDPLAQCLAAAKGHGIAVHVWKVNWHLWWNCPPAFRQELAKAGRLQVDPHGGVLDWLCPSHPDNQRLECDAMVDVARRYEIAGVHLDYIRYPGEEGCYCAGCRERFEAAIQAPVANWPGDVLSGQFRGQLREQFLQFRRDNITRLVAAVRQQIQQIRPSVQLSAAVFPDSFSARDQVGQDWPLWVEKGYLDFVCTMQYGDNTAFFAGQTQQNQALGKGRGGRVPIYPGIGATLGLDPPGTLEQVLATRKQATGGFVLFNLSQALRPHLDLLAQGATRRATTQPSTGPAPTQPAQ